MNQTKTNGSEKNQSRVEAILATEEDLIPSSGFLASVMESVHEEARLPQPLPFPWKRALPGILLTGSVFGLGAVELFRYVMPTVSCISLIPPHHFSALERPLEETGWVALALGVSLLSWLFSRRLAGRSGLL
ncbi:MAG: hypothetical protein ACLQLH_00890 [Terracidiphilus sp.]